jgi:hypothetical protein
LTPDRAPLWDFGVPSRSHAGSGKWIAQLLVKTAESQREKTPRKAWFIPRWRDASWGIES